MEKQYMEKQHMEKTKIKILEEMKNMDIRTVVIDESRPIAERVASFVQQIQNPYCFRVGDMAVKVVYQEEGPTFQQNFESMLLSL